MAPNTKSPDNFRRNSSDEENPDESQKDLMLPLVCTLHSPTVFFSCITLHFLSQTFAELLFCFLRNNSE